MRDTLSSRTNSSRRLAAPKGLRSHRRSVSRLFARLGAGSLPLFSLLSQTRHTRHLCPRPRGGREHHRGTDRGLRTGRRRSSRSVERHAPMFSCSRQPRACLGAEQPCWAGTAAGECRRRVSSPPPYTVPFRPPLSLPVLATLLETTAACESGIRLSMVVLVV